MQHERIGTQGIKYPPCRRQCNKGGKNVAKCAAAIPPGRRSKGCKSACKIFDKTTHGISLAFTEVFVQVIFQPKGVPVQKEKNGHRGIACRRMILYKFKKSRISGLSPKSANAWYRRFCLINWMANVCTNRLVFIALPPVIRFAFYTYIVLLYNSKK